MKKILAVLAAGLPVFLFGASGASASKPIARIGFMTDTHIQRDKASCALAKKAFELFRGKGVDAICHGGDLADWHYESGYRFYREAYEEAYAGAKREPRLLYVFGNHDALNPAEQTDRRQPHMLDLREAFEDMKRLLKIDHGLLVETEVNGVPVLVTPQSQDLVGGTAEIERRILAMEAKYPTGPIVFLAHIPPRDTTCGSGRSSDPTTKALFQKHPRVISFTGHTHNSLRNELCIWQGGFTAVDMGCLQVWHGGAVGFPARGKKASEVIVAEFFPHEVVLHRYDVLDGREIGADDPWVVAQPYDPSAPAYAATTRAKKERRGRFPKDAKVSFGTDTSPFDELTVTFPCVANADDVYVYLVKVEKNEDGAWTSVFRGEKYGEFWVRPSERTGVGEAKFSAAYFDEGVRYRFTVKPRGFFGTEGDRAISAEWTCPPKKVWKTVLDMTNPMSSKGLVYSVDGWKTERNFTVRSDGWIEIGDGKPVMRLPKGTWDGEKGRRFRVSADIACRNVGGTKTTLTISLPDRWSAPCDWLTFDGSRDSFSARGVFDFKWWRVEHPDWTLNFGGKKGMLFRVDHILVETVK